MQSENREKFFGEILVFYRFFSALGDQDNKMRGFIETKRRKPMLTPGTKINS